MVRLMALDVGKARIGVAVCDRRGFLASPYTTLHVTRNEEQTWIGIQQLIEETEAEGLVVGLPISMDGQIHGQGEWVQAFVERLKRHITVPVTLWDERLSTVEARRLLAQRAAPWGDEAGVNEGRGRQRRTIRRRTQTKRRQRDQEIDAYAAAVILQDYLDTLGEKTEGAP
ncbi:MAG: Holliday junction resolvase RuvX [Ktedonobacteraceae bacterium]